MRLITVQLAYQALRPGGRLILATLIRGLISHLEFYQHFGHVAFIYPQLLTFLYGLLRFQQADRLKTCYQPDRIMNRIPWQAGLPARTPNLPEILHAPWSLFGGGWSGVAKCGWCAGFVRPPMENRLMGRLAQDEQLLAAYSAALNRPFECYAIGDKAVDP